MTRRVLPVLAAGAALLAGCTSSVAGTPSQAAAPVTLEGTQVADHAIGQQHVRTDVDYAEDPPVGGPHDPVWADCTGSVYDVPVRAENAVHSLEHGALWLTYDPDLASADDVAALTGLVDGVPHRMLSPHPGLGVTVSAQAWNHRLTADSGDDPRLAAFADLLTANPETTPEPGATCENPAFLADPATP
ncbi:DUF3105 domain-containing protein [Blastococcus sp. SYSU D00695]